MRRLLATSFATALASVTGANAQDSCTFERIASFAVACNPPEGADPWTEMVSEIVLETPNGVTVVHTDSPLGALGFIDIPDPANPRRLGATMLGREPISIDGRGETSVSPQENEHLATVSLDGAC